MSARAKKWKDVLETPGACDHVAQLYTDDAFLTEALGHFLGTGFARGEAGVVIATPQHRVLFTEGLTDAAGAVARGQLVMLDAATCLATFMVDGMPQRERFTALLEGVLDTLRSAGYRTARLYGEMVNLLWEQGALDAAIRIEELWNDFLRAHGLPLLCAYRIDPFDRYAHASALAPISKAHSHLIPLADYARFDHAVDRAYADVFGVDGDAELLRDLLVRSLGPMPTMPRAQATLFAVREVSARTADAVLDRAKRYYSEGASTAPSDAARA